MTTRASWNTVSSFQLRSAEQEDGSFVQTSCKHVPEGCCKEYHLLWVINRTKWKFYRRVFFSRLLSCVVLHAGLSIIVTDPAHTSAAVWCRVKLWWMDCQAAGSPVWCVFVCVLVWCLVSPVFLLDVWWGQPSPCQPFVPVTCHMGVFPSSPTPCHYHTLVKPSWFQWLQLWTITVLSG